MKSLDAYRIPHQEVGMMTQQLLSDLSGVQSGIFHLKWFLESLQEQILWLQWCRKCTKVSRLRVASDLAKSILSSGNIRNLNVNTSTVMYLKHPNSRDDLDPRQPCGLFAGQIHALWLRGHCAARSEMDDGNQQTQWMGRCRWMGHDMLSLQLGAFLKPWRTTVVFFGTVHGFSISVAPGLYRLGCASSDTWTSSEQCVGLTCANCADSLLRVRLWGLWPLRTVRLSKTLIARANIWCKG